MYPRQDMCESFCRSHIAKQLGLLLAVSPTYPVAFFRPAWNLVHGQWIMASFRAPPAQFAIVLCVICTLQMAQHFEFARWLLMPR